MTKTRRSSPILVPTHDHCGLCLRQTRPCNSHIIANYMGEWMKAASATKKFRSADAPNRTEQDLPKIPLLCEECEQRIKKYEDKFKAAVWDPWCAKVGAALGELPEDLPLPQEEWMGLFVFSVAWRALHVSDDHNGRRSELLPHAKAADDEWRPALLAGKMPGPRSWFWAIQSKRIDEVLRQRKHVENRCYILLSTHIENSDCPMERQHSFQKIVRVNVNGVPMHFSTERAFLLGTTPAGTGYYISLVKGFGFCFFGVHTQDREVAATVNLKEVEELLLDCSIRAWDERILKKLSPTQKAKDEAAKKANVSNPTLSMQIKAADERARVERMKEGR